MYRKKQNRVSIRFKIPQHFCLGQGSETFYSQKSKDSYTNRSYHNAIFPVKRRRIIDTDKNCTENIFIPPCTRNVFTKYYTQMAVSITQWTQQDAEDYRMAIADALAGLINAAGYGIKDKTENENE